MYLAVGFPSLTPMIGGRACAFLSPSPYVSFWSTPEEPPSRMSPLLLLLLLLLLRLPLEGAGAPVIGRGAVASSARRASTRLAPSVSLPLDESAIMAGGRVVAGV